MSNNTPFTLYEKLKENYEKYIKTGHPIHNDDVKSERDDLISSVLFQEPYIEYISAYSQEGGELEKVLNKAEDQDLKEFLQFDDSLFPEKKGYKFFTHQKEALDRNNKHIIVTTGTGSGKTETFLLPIVRNLLEESKEWGRFNGLIQDNWRLFTSSVPKYHREGEEDGRAAVRAMILYPLNALVDDQLIRLRKLFNSDDAIKFLKEKRKGNRIYFGRYTSDTPVAGNYSNTAKIDEFKKALNKIKSYENATFTGRDNTEDSNKKAQKEGKYFLPSLNGSEMYSRWDMQEFPPDILITNYSMLNIMLMRNIESDIFEKTKVWLQKNKTHKFQLVIDELHTYRGTAGTEIAYLIRLLLDRLGLSPDSEQLQIIASSASLGDNKERCNKFLTEFFGVSDPESFNIINGDLELPQQDITYKITPAQYANINDPKLLYDNLKEDNAFEYLKGLLYDQSSNAFVAKSLSQLAKENNKDESFFKDLISAISRSSNGKQADVPIRVHYFFRNLRGIWACTNPHCTEVHEKYKKNSNRNIGKLYAEPKTICKCGGRILELLICPTCGELFFGGFRNEDDNKNEASAYLFPETADLEKLPEYCNSSRTVSNYYVFTPGIYELSEDAAKSVKIKFKEGKKADVSNEYTWINAHYNYSDGFLKLDSINENVMVYSSIKTKDNRGSALPFICPKCNDNWARIKEASTLPLIKPMNYGFQKINQILADSLLYEQKSISKDGSKSLILFTDSRQDAAKLSAGIEMDHYRDTLRQFAYFVTKNKASKFTKLISLLNNYQNLSNEEKILARAQRDTLGADGQIIWDYIREGKDCCDDVTIARANELIDNPSIKYTDLVKEIYTNALQLGINPGGYTTNYIGDKTWSDFFLYENNEYKGSTGNIEHEKFEEKIRRMLVRELFKTLFHAHRGFEALGVGIVTFNRSKYTNLSKEQIELFDAIIRLYGEKGRYEHSNAEDQENPITMVKKYLKRVWGYSVKGNESIQFKNDLEKIMNKLYSMNIIHKETQKLVSDSLYILPYNEEFYYICPSCKKIHLNKSNGICINQYCGSKLKKINKRLILEGNFYYELSQKEPEKLTVEEATAQTDKNDQKSRQRRFQDLYIQKDNIKECALKDSIEILSVTTTMEAGVDIGALDSVMMANMPPQRFNYQQRVGRAGRRRKGLAVALTVCRNRNHDEYYFKNPDRIINEPTPPPYLDTSSESILERFVAKEVLRTAISESSLSELYESASKDVHGEFGTVAQWNKKYKNFIIEHTGFPVKNEVEFVEDVIYTEDIVQDWILNQKNDKKIYEIIDKLIKKTELKNKKEKFFKYAKEYLISEINQKIEQNWVDYTSLSELLANAGILPMFGFPTRERVLKTNKIEKSNISRDLDLALSQFAPKGETVKDKKIHISIGIESKNLSQNNTKKYFVCSNCGTVVELDNENILICPKCDNEGKIIKGVQPEGFFTLEYLQKEKKPLDYDGNFDFRPFAHRPQINQNTELVLSEQYNNCKYLKTEKLVQLVSINDNSGMLYNFKKCGNKDLWVSEDAVAVYDDKFKKIKLPILNSEKSSDTTSLWNLGDSKEVALISTKMTDVFILEIDKVPENINLAIINEEGKTNIYAKSAYYSLAFLLRAAVAKELDIDDKEIVVGILPNKIEQNLPTAQVFLSDNLVNGAGYSRWLSQESHLKNLLEQLDEKNEKFNKIYNDEHSKNCDSSCYLCMQDYANLHYHGLLNWRLGFDLVDMLKNSKFTPSLKTKRWNELALKSLKNLFEFIKTTDNTSRTFELIEKDLQVISSDNVIYQIVHPLEKMPLNAKICYINILDIIKRPNEVQKSLKKISSLKSKPQVKKNFRKESAELKNDIIKKQKSGIRVKIDNNGMLSENIVSAFKQLINEGQGYLNDNELKIYHSILSKSINGDYEPPLIDATIKINNKEFHPVMVWPSSQVALFDDSEEYSEAEDLDSCFDFYLVESNMSVDGFLNDIKII